MKILFVDDDRSAVKPIEDALDDADGEIKHDWTDFPEANRKIDAFLPDIIVLDLFVGRPQDGEATGTDTLAMIWDHHFCPVILYSANPDIAGENYREHPFIKTITKGSDSDQEAVAAICDLRPVVDRLAAVQEEARKAFSIALRYVSQHAPRDNGDAVAVVHRAARRRLAALLDDTTATGRPLDAWEQYVFPPVSSNIQLGDVLRLKDGNKDPESYRVVLTPSCDLVRSNGREAKVKNVMVARCCSVAEALSMIGLGDNLKKTLRSSRFRDILTVGFGGSIIPFPALGKSIPSMAANLKDLQLIPLNEVDAKYEIVASVDSPFRETVAWAYIQTAARPGLPDRDIESWRREIKQAVAE